MPDRNVLLQAVSLVLGPPVASGGRPAAAVRTTVVLERNVPPTISAADRRARGSSASGPTTVQLHLQLQIVRDVGGASRK
jgi:hypothetical protein